jgi:hypothetical protein
MKIFGVQLRQPALSDLPLVAFILVFAAALVALSMFALGWDIGQASAIIYGFTAVAIASSCGVDFREHGFCHESRRNEAVRQDGFDWRRECTSHANE